MYRCRRWLQERERAGVSFFLFGRSVQVQRLWQQERAGAGVGFGNRSVQVQVQVQVSALAAAGACRQRRIHSLRPFLRLLHLGSFERLDWVPVVFLQQSRFEFYHQSTTTSISFAAAPIRSPIKPTPP